MKETSIIVFLRSREIGRLYQKMRGKIVILAR